MQFGKLEFQPISDHPELSVAPVYSAVQTLGMQEVLIAKIDDTLADTAAFCEHYRVGLEVSANCIIVEAKRADRTWHAACMILATSRIDINGTVRRHLNARKISFAPTDSATSLTGMEYGGITPIGLPADWPILIDAQVAHAGHVVIGSGIRGSKILVPGNTLGSLPNATILDIAR